MIEKIADNQKILCTANEGLEPPTKLLLLLSEDRKDPLEAFFDITALGGVPDLWPSKPPP